MTAALTTTSPSSGDMLVDVVDKALRATQSFQAQVDASSARVRQIEDSAHDLESLVQRLGAQFSEQAASFEASLTRVETGLATQPPKLRDVEVNCLGDARAGSPRGRQLQLEVLVQAYSYWGRRLVEARPSNVTTQARDFARSYSDLEARVKKEIKDFDQDFATVDVAVGRLKHGLEEATTIGTSVKAITAASDSLPAAVNPVHARLLEAVTSASEYPTQRLTHVPVMSDKVTALSTRLKDLFGEVDGTVGFLENVAAPIVSTIGDVDDVVQKAKVVVHDKLGPVFHKVEDVLEALKPLKHLVELLEKYHIL